MAIVPQNEDAFFREVDEELRRDRLESFAQRYWRWVLAAVLVALLALAGALAWRAHRQSLAGGDAEQLNAALAALGAGDVKGAAGPLDAVAASPQPAYRALAGLTTAAMSAGKGELVAAIARYKRVADDAQAPPALRDVARVRQTAIEYDLLPPAEVIARLKPLATPGSPWFGSAGEMVGLAYLRAGKPAEAGPLFGAIARDARVPDTIRARAAQMASGLGVDPGPPILDPGASGQ